MGLSAYHVIVCPFCQASLPMIYDFDSIHRCECGACYKVCSQRMLEKSVQDIAWQLWTDEELEFIQRVPIDVCNIVVEKEFDRLLNLKQLSDTAGSRFCKYDISDQLSLVWVKRLI
jgi:TATA-box binding protein (TBP) (component of TFIID and TFIIIB)